MIQCVSSLCCVCRNGMQLIRNGMEAFSISTSGVTESGWTLSLMTTYPQGIYMYPVPTSFLGKW